MPTRFIFSKTVDFPGKVSTGLVLFISCSRIGNLVSAEYVFLGGHRHTSFASNPASTRCRFPACRQWSSEVRLSVI